MSDAGLRSGKRRRTGRPVEALAVFTTRPRPPDGTRPTESGGVERHYRKCEFHHSSLRDPSSPLMVNALVWLLCFLQVKESWRRSQELQADVPNSSSVNFATADPQELLAQAEMHQASLEEQRQALASLEHRVERGLLSSAPQEPLGPGPVGETLLKIRESVRRWEFL